MARRPVIEPCHLPEPPIDAELRCAACAECLVDAIGQSEGTIDQLSAAGRCGRWLVDRAGRAILAGGSLFLGTAEGAELDIAVTDADGAVLEIAVFRVPELDADHVYLDKVTGTWRGDALPVWKGDAVPLPVGEITLEVSSPGYINQQITVTLRKRKVRRVRVQLEKMVLDLDADIDDPVIFFGRDKPLD